MGDAGSEHGGPPAPEPKPRRWSWLVKGTILFVAINALGVGVLAAHGAAKPNGFCGGFSGYSGGGGGCATDLSIAAFDAPDPVGVHGRLFYLIEVTNKGPSGAGSIEIQDKLPGSFRVDWVLSSERYSECSVQGSAVFCEFFGLSEHQKAAVTIVARPNQAGQFTNVASVSGFGNDPNPANNKATVRTTVR